MKDYQKKKEEVLQFYESSEKGLTSAQAAAAGEKYGKNQLTEGKKKSALQIFLEQFTDFLVIILILAAAISGILGDWESTIVILVVITMNAILGTVQQLKAEQSLNSLKKLSAPVAKVLRDGQVVLLPSEEVVVGDVVQLEAGDYICADGRILEQASLKVNESALTGESLSVEKTAEVISGEVPLGDQVNMAFSGSFVTYGRGSFVVTKVGMDTEVGKIASLLNNAAEKKTPLQVNLDQFGKKLSILILLICAVLFGISMFRGESLIDAFMFAVALAVAAIPEALSSIVTIVLAFGTQKMAKEHAIIRKLQAVEGLGSVSVICSDKTGTLTQNKMTVRKCYVQEQVLEAEQPVSGAGAKKLIQFGVLCSDASNQDGVEIGDPTEVALINLANRQGQDADVLRREMPRMAELPFDSDRKLMTTLYKVDGVCTLITKGAVDVLLQKLTMIEGKEGVRAITEADKETIQAKNLEFSNQGLRVLAFGYRPFTGENLTLSDERDYIFLGLVAMMDPPRPEAKEAVAKCKMAGIRPIMITGDHKITASAIAREIGILTDETIAVEGSVMDGMSDEELKNFVDQVSVYARVTPEHKIRIVRAWQEKGNIVSMTGDGVNDAPALKQADVGVAMGITGTEVSKDASSMVLTDDNFATIVKAVENGRNVYANIKKSIKFLLSGNTAGILAVLYASICGLAVPFAPVHLLFINLLTDSLPAIALGLDPHSEAVMEEKPRPINESILTKDFLLGILGEGICIAFNTMAAYYVGLSAGGAGLASTMAFATLCLSRLVHGYNSKSARPVVFTKQMWDNKFLGFAFLAGFVLLNAVLLIPVLAPVFEVTALTAGQLFTIYGLSACTLVEVQILKALKRKK